ncbi:DUF2442 domain-containing protein [Clostridium sp.]|uniref:DUF2442 domain-containing protein n=1 Tax=Clostridium sp. TaxID=1506 RepID=UPI0025C0F80C|nr:DUF2442 domain-containing protein [Clostridium sp.]
MDHMSMIKMELHFPYIIGTFENRERYRYDIREMVPERPEYKQLLNEEYFYKAELSPGGWGISWDDFVDMHADGVANFGERIE